ncbi:hypothetical protein G6F50_015025 [Rhizopus delemar]|uniref:Ribulose-phosphate 3-epimerase n=1 Tax=Rhizopus delemar TaxID=936053 RepID=A0A9P7C5S0_9FUNG|nr:hypothetical protein G6F50_015025 [Rhizopus delemar]
MDKIDLVLIMSVNPGFGGQSFIPGALTKLREARAKIDAWMQAGGQEIVLQVDGGVKIDNIAEIRRAGADTFVAGAAIFGKPDYAGIITSMREQIAIGEQINPGVPWCAGYTPVAEDDVSIALKSGNFGTPDFFIKAFG